ncbi:MAG: hypothetical protein VX640_12685 [Pseudomonadota bacterium]|nr:hypothetical protein [Pseudomonadota bacterium]
MTVKLGAVVIGAAATAVGAAVLIYGGSQLLKERSIETTLAEGAADGKFICLKTKISFAAGADKGCYSRDEIEAFDAAPLLDDHGAPVSVSLSHPTDMSRPQATASTCADWRRLTGEGWYALSTADMRREAWFVRACGTLALLKAARRADLTHFEDAAASEADMESLAATAPFRIGPAEEGAPTAEVSRAGPAEWRLSVDGQFAVVQEIAHADFNADGLGDLLVFVSLNAGGGTATASRTGLLVKLKPAGPVRFVEK